MLENIDDLSPISCFNNIQLQITKNLYNILYPELNGEVSKMMFKNQIVFLDNSIIFLNCFKLEIFHDNDVRIKCLKSLNKAQLKLIVNIYNSWDEVVTNFCQYVIMYNKIAYGFDDVPFTLVDYIIKAIKKKDTKKLDKYFILPYKNKIKILYDTFDDDQNENKNVIKNIFERYEYLVKFGIKSNFKFTYFIGKFLSSELDESKSLENLRYKDIDIIKKDSLSIRNCDEFVKQLFYYGEIDGKRK